MNYQYIARTDGPVITGISVSYPADSGPLLTISHRPDDGANIAVRGLMNYVEYKRQQPRPGRTRPPLVRPFSQSDAVHPNAHGCEDPLELGGHTHGEYPEITPALIESYKVAMDELEANPALRARFFQPLPKDLTTQAMDYFFPSDQPPFDPRAPIALFAPQDKAELVRSFKSVYDKGLLNPTVNFDQASPKEYKPYVADMNFPGCATGVSPLLTAWQQQQVADAQQERVDFDRNMHAVGAGVAVGFTAAVFCCYGLVQTCRGKKEQKQPVVTAAHDMKKLN